MTRNHGKLRAAVQMDRDCIRSLTRLQKSRSSCGFITFADENASVRCGVSAGYETPLGKRCCKHALLQARSEPTPSAHSALNAENSEMIALSRGRLA